jgi:hypothetical protein
MNNDALTMMARIVKSLVDKSGPYKLKPTQNDVPHDPEQTFYSMLMTLFLEDVEETGEVSPYASFSERLWLEAGLKPVEHVAAAQQLEITWNAWHNLYQALQVGGRLNRIPG